MRPVEPVVAFLVIIIVVVALGVGISNVVENWSAVEPAPPTTKYEYCYDIVADVCADPGDNVELAWCQDKGWEYE